MSRTSATLGWLKPLRDGGAKINGYVVDYQEEGAPQDKWTPYSVVKDLTIVVVGLKEGKKYKFRVAARNSVGVSLAREAKGVFEAKEQLSEYTGVEVQCRRIQTFSSEGRKQKFIGASSNLALGPSGGYYHGS